MMRSLCLLLSPFVFSVAIAPALALPPNTKPTEGLHDNPVNTIALTHAKVVASPGEVLEDATIVVRDGSIIAIGKNAMIPPGSKIEDLQGKTVYAGLIDAYGEATLTAPTSANKHWNAQITPESSVAPQYQIDTAQHEKLRGQGIVVRLVAPATGIVKGTSALITTSSDANERLIWKPEVAQHVRLGASRGRTRGYPNSPMGAVALARQTFLDASWYRDAWSAHRANGSLPRPEQNDSLAALAEVSQGTGTVIFDTPNELYYLRADAFAKEFSLSAIIRGSGQEYQRLDAIAATGRPIILPLNFPRPPVVSTPEAARTADLGDLMHWDLAPENPAKLHQAGVRIAFTSFGLQDAGQFLTQVRTAVKRGLPADAALKAMTVTPAELFGVSDRLGSLAIGKSASFVITDGDLFAKETKIVATWIDGRKYELERAPSLDIAGRWKVSVTDADQSKSEWDIKLSGKSPRLSGSFQLKKDGKSEEIKYERLSLRDKTLSGSFPAKPFDQTGVVQFSAVILAPPGGEATMTGSFIWPNGTSATFTARRFTKEETAAADAEDKSKAQKPSEEKAKAEKDQSTEDGSKKTDKEPPAGDKPTDSKPEDEKPADEKPAASDPEKKDPEKKDPGTNDSAQQPQVAPQPEQKDSNESTPRRSRASAKGDSAKPAEGGEQTGGDAKAGEAKPGAEVEKSSFEVNYPLGAFGRSQAPEQPKHVAFTHATVWTAGPQGTLKDATVLITEGKIAAVGNQVAIPDGAVVIDATGKHLSPGIIDCHSHMATDGGVNEGSQAITAEVRIGDFIDCDDINVYRQLAGGVTAANILHGSANPIGGQNQVIKLRWGALFDEMRFKEAPPGIKFALGENVKRSNMQAEDIPSRYPTSRMGVEQIIRDEFAAARRYQEQWELYRKNHDTLPPRRDLELETVAEILRGERWVHCHSYRQDEILALLRTCEEFGIRIATLQHILEGYKVADAIQRHGAMSSSFSDWWAYKIEVYDAIPFNGALMHNAGVVVSFNSDDQELARHLNHEAAKAVKYGGIPEEEAIKFVTLNPAKQLRVDAYVGSIEVGKHADVVLWSDAPLSVFSRCEQTWIDGRKYFDRSDDAARQKQAAEMRATLVQKALASGQRGRTGSENERPEEELWLRYDEYCAASSDGTRK